VELDAWLPALALEPVEGCVEPLIEPCDPLVGACAFALVSVPVELVEADPFEGVEVPCCAVAWPPAVVPAPDIELGCVVPVSFADVRVFLLLLLQPKTSATASAKPDAYFMCCLLKRGCFERRSVGGRRTTPGSPGCGEEVAIAQAAWKLLLRPVRLLPDVLESDVLARCPSCHNTFSTERTGRQICPVCGKPLVVPEPPAASATAPTAELVSEPQGTPWERRGELGFWAGWGQTVQQALLEPGRLFASARLDRGGAQLGFAVLTSSVFWAIGQILERLLLRGQTDRMRQLLAAASRNPDVAPMLQRMLDVQSRASSPGAVLALAALTPVFTFVMLYLNAGVTHAVAAVLGQAKRGFPATFAACAYASAPLVLLAVPACGSIVGVIWLIVLTGIGMKVTHRISTGGAAASVLVPYLVLCCLTFLAMGALAMALRNAAGQP
jgi:hypothetical protein